MERKHRTADEGGTEETLILLLKDGGGELGASSRQGVEKKE